MPENKSSKLPYKEVAFFEDSIARQNRIIREAQSVAFDIDDPDVLERVISRLAQIIEAANVTRNALIDQRAKREQEIQEANGE